MPIGIPKPPQPKPKKKKKKPVVEKATADFYSFIGSKPEPYDKEKFDMALSLAKRTDFYEEKLEEGRYPFLDRDINEEILNEEMAAKIRRQIYEEILSLFGAEKEVLDIVDPQEIKSNISQIIELDKKITEAPPPPPKLSKREEEQLEESLDNFVNITTGPESVIESSDPSGNQTPSLLDLGVDTVGTGQSALEEAVESGMSQEDTTAVQKMQDVEFAKETLAELKVDRIKRQETLLPPLPPNSDFFTIDKEIDRLFIILSPSTGRIRKKFPPSLFLKDWEMVRQELSKEKFQEFGDFSTPNEMLFSGIERPAAYEVLKLNEKPTKISDFLKAQKILVDPNLGIYEDHNIKANHKYYYAFRSIEEDNTLTEQFNDGLISYISDPIEVELVNEGNISFLTTKPLLLNEEEKKHYVKTFRRRIRIQPSLLQTIPVIKEADIGNLDDSCFDPENKFKVRLTSAKTGRKIDLNIKFVKNKFKQAEPPEGSRKLFNLVKCSEDDQCPPGLLCSGTVKNDDIIFSFGNCISAEIVEAERKKAAESLIGKPTGKCSVPDPVFQLVAAAPLVGGLIGGLLKQAADKAETKTECDDLRPLLEEVLEEMEFDGDPSEVLSGFTKPLKGDFAE